MLDIDLDANKSICILWRLRIRILLTWLFLDARHHVSSLHDSSYVGHLLVFSHLCDSPSETYFRELCTTIKSLQCDEHTHAHKSSPSTPCLSPSCPLLFSLFLSIESFNAPTLSHATMWAHMGHWLRCNSFTSSVLKQVFFSKLIDVLTSHPRRTLSTTSWHAYFSFSLACGFSLALMNIVPNQSSLPLWVSQLLSLHFLPSFSSHQPFFSLLFLFLPHWTSGSFSCVPWSPASTTYYPHVDELSAFGRNTWHFLSSRSSLCSSLSCISFMASSHTDAVALTRCNLSLISILHLSPSLSLSLFGVGILVNQSAHQLKSTHVVRH